MALAQSDTTAYFGFSAPKDRPDIFAPGFISLENRIEGRGAFSADNKQFYFTISDEKFANQKIFFTKFSGNNWSTPDTVDFSKNFACWEPYLSHDNQKIYFTGNKELTDSTTNCGQGFYYTQRNKINWTEPKKLNKPISSDYKDLFFTELANKNIYFTSNRPDRNKGFQIHFAHPLDDGKYEIKNIGLPVNKGRYNWDPCISSDESFMIFVKVKMIRVIKKADLYITYNKEGKWSKPKRLGHKINTNANEYGPFLSNDNKYLFFTRLGRGNKGDIYWIDINSVLKK